MTWVMKMHRKLRFFVRECAGWGEFLTFINVPQNTASKSIDPRSLRSYSTPYAISENLVQEYN